MLPLLGALAAPIVSAGMGLLMEGHNDRRQLRQQKKLNAQQIKAQKELAAYQKSLNLEMWQDTNYAAQAAEMRKAGLSTGLMYGMGGGGGATSNAGSGGSVTGGQAQQYPGEMGMALQTGLQTAMQQAMIKKTEAETKKIEIDTAKTSGVDTEQVKQSTAVLAEQVKSEKLKQAAMEYENAMKQIELDVKRNTQEETTQRIKKEKDKMEGEAKSAQAKGEIDEATKQTTIDMVRQSAVEQDLRIQAQRKGLTLTDEQIRKVGHEILRLTTQSDIEWQKLDLERQQTEIRKLIQEFITSDAAKMRQWADIIFGASKIITAE